jgi:A/G-specific adenine glycosylase
MPRAIPPAQRTRLRRTLLAWYRSHARDYPWRRTRDPYVILLSEIMLQQTQAGRVVERLPLFFGEFPTVGALAAAPRSAVIRAWKGMGYNRRAVHLHEAARAIAAHGSFPRTVVELRALPGIGAYTASAVACFAFNMPVVVIDVNIRRVLSRLVAGRRALDDLYSAGDTARVAELFLPARTAHEWNQGLMDIGAQYCKARSAHCGICPMRRVCASAPLLGRARPVARAARLERSRNGIPDRLWRGRIVDALRTRSFTFRSLGAAIDPMFTNDERAWLNRLVNGLVAHGLVAVSGEHVKLA